MLPPSVFPGARVVEVQLLNKAFRALLVKRLTLEMPDGEARSVIVKQIHALPGDDQRNERDSVFFREERVNYVFLESLDTRFPFAPRLLDDSPEQIVLEDLGDSEPLLSMQAMVGIVAQSLAALHNCTAEAESHYRAVRQSLGCEFQPEAAWLSITLSDAFRMGRKTVTDWLSALSPRDVAVWQHSAADAERRIAGLEGRTRAFVHHDLVSSRQCVFRGRSIYLIDYEHSRFAHRLLDVATLLIGKLEVASDDTLVHIHASLPPAFAAAYRRKWDLMLASPTTDVEWRTELVAVLLWQTVVEIGRCVSMPHRRFLLGLLGSVRSILQRFLGQLILFDDVSVPVGAAIGNLLQRMPG